MELYFVISSLNKVDKKDKKQYTTIMLVLRSQNNSPRKMYKD